VPTAVIAVPERRTGSARSLVNVKDLERMTLLIGKMLVTSWKA
jgi:putative aminopeptidase FrvX